MQLARTDGRHTRTLLALVIVMGVLIVVGTVIVVATVINRMSSVARPVSASPSGFDNAYLTLPAGCEVVEATPTADRLVLRLGTGERCNLIIIVDLATGRALGRLNLVPGH